MAWFLRCVLMLMELLGPLSVQLRQLDPQVDVGGWRVILESESVVSSRTRVFRVSPLLPEVRPIPEATFGVSAELAHLPQDRLISRSSLRDEFSPFESCFQVDLLLLWGRVILCATGWILWSWTPVRVILVLALMVHFAIFVFDFTADLTASGWFSAIGSHSSCPNFKPFRA